MTLITLKVLSCIAMNNMYFCGNPIQDLSFNQSSNVLFIDDAYLLTETPTRDKVIKILFNSNSLNDLPRKTGCRIRVLEKEFISSSLCTELTKQYKGNNI